MSFFSDGLHGPKAGARGLAALVIAAAAIVAIAVPATQPGKKTICAPPARLGCAAPKTRGVLPRQFLNQNQVQARLFPDISEYEGCPTISSPVVFKVYEWGYGQDHSAYCNANQVRAKHLLAGVYAFLRPGPAQAEADAFWSRVVALRVPRGPLIADAEVPLPSGFVNSYLSRLAHDSGWPVAVYSSPGTWAGGRVIWPLWVATYGPHPGCVSGDCNFVAWQFSSTYLCHGIRGDCSINWGLLVAPTPPKPPVNNNAKKIALLRSYARHRRCYDRKVQRHLRACKVWAAEVQALQK